MRRAALLVVAALAAVVVPGCSLPGGGESGYHLTAYFARAVGLYPHGDVTVMGIDVGTVNHIEIDDQRVRVEMTIDDDVPLPVDVHATIEPLTLIGERNVVLFPAWTEAMAAAGTAKATDGDVIPVERTEVPVEPDEGLEAFNDLARSLDPEVVAGLVSDSADVLEGNGARIGEALDHAATLSTTFAGIDGQLLAIAESLHVLAGSLTTRDAQLRALVASFSEATGVLAAERDDIARLLSNLVRLTDEGRSILSVYGDQLPGDIANLAALASVFEQNIGSIDQLISSFPAISAGIANAYSEEAGGVVLRADLNPTMVALLDELTTALGIA